MASFRNVHVVALLFCVGTVSLLSCIKNPAGTSAVPVATGNGNIVTGVLYQEDGTTPAAGATVYLRPRSDNTDLLDGAISCGAAELLTKSTNADGTFRFEESLQCERICIHGVKSDSLCVLIDSIVNDSVVHVKGILKKPGRIQAVFPLLKPDGAILINGEFNFTGVVGDYDASGTRLTFKVMAEGVYDLTFIASWDPYIIIQKSGVRVISRETTSLDTLVFPSVGIPGIYNFESYSKCDKVTRIVSLRWEHLDTSLVSGFYVYRQDEVSGAMVRIVDAPVVDTFYIDSTFNDSLQHPLPESAELYRNSAGEPASIVLYHVRAVSKDGFAGQPAMYFAFFN